MPDDFTLGGGIDVTVDPPRPIDVIAVPVTGQPGRDGTDGAKGDTGSPGTTDYNQLQNKPDLSLKVTKPTTTNDLHIYGDSNADAFTLVPSYVTDEDHMDYKLAAVDMGGGVATSYGFGGKRINMIAGSMLSQSAWPGLPAPRAGTLWPGVIARPGDVVIDTEGNDAGHYSGVGATLPVAIAGAGGTRYLNAIGAAFVAAMGVCSSESSVLLTTAGAPTFSTSPAWTGSKSLAVAQLKGGVGAYSTVAGSYVEKSITPPQTGPLAGKVYLTTLQVDPTSGSANADITISVDGVAMFTWAKSEWEAYTGAASVLVSQVPAGIEIDVPVDGAAHTIRATHAGTTGQFMWVNALFLASTTPPNIFVRANQHQIPCAAGISWTPTQIALWEANRALTRPIMLAAIARFPNAHFVPCTMTPAGTSQVDGIHPNNFGMRQRANDLVSAWRNVLVQPTIGRPT